MSRKKQTNASGVSKQKGSSARNDELFRELIDWFVPPGQLFHKSQFHGNVSWNAEELAVQALTWAWQETKNVTDAFRQTREICADLKLFRVVTTYTAFMNALTRYRRLFQERLRERLQILAEKIAGDRFRTGEWVPLAFDGSRSTAPRTVSNERAFCAPNYGRGKKARYRRNKSKGQVLRQDQANAPQPQEPQVWITMMWHMGLRLPWSWRLGPSNSSERADVQDMLENEKFPEKTLFCGDAGFTGYPLWSAILNAGQHFLVRVGANVKLLSEQADIKKCGGGIVLCWPKKRMNSGAPPLRLRLVQVTVGKTKMWMLTSVLDRRRLSKKQIVKLYQLRWGIEVEYRGLKQTLDKQKLRSRKSDRLLVELEWSILAMAVAELLALREQLRDPNDDYSPQDLSLANTMRALRTCMRQLHRIPEADDHLLYALSQATVQRYENRTDKRARYRPKNPDKKPLGDPKVTRVTPQQSRKLQQHEQKSAA